MSSQLGDLTAIKDDVSENGRNLEDIAAERDAHRLSSQSGGSLLQDLLNISPVLTDAAAAVVDDSFLRCFQGARPDPWNWNIYLFPLWLLGCVMRWGVLFPLRLILLTLGFTLFFIAFFGIRLCLKAGPRRAGIERSLVQAQCWIFVASWTGVITYHGPHPTPRANAVWVCNHTSMIDYIILTACSPFAVIMQLHPGWVGFLQTQVLGCLGCLWFNRNEVKDRQIVSQRMQAHVASSDTTPLLIFPEGTCVNNEFCVMFKKGAFELEASVFPVAIRYNKIFVDAFWNSKKQSFTAHLLRLMTSWAVVCDVFFLPPQNRLKDESSQQFAERVQHLIAHRAKLTVAPWDGYLKYYNLGVKKPDLIEKRRQAFAENLRRYLHKSPKKQP